MWMCLSDVATCFRRHYDKLDMEEGGKHMPNGTGEPQANGRAYSQEPVASYLTLHSLMNCGLIKCAARSCRHMSAQSFCIADPGSAGRIATCGDVKLQFDLVGATICRCLQLDPQALLDAKDAFKYW